MAVDTQEKRMNAAHAGSVVMRAKLATGSFDEQARIASGMGYGGNALMLDVEGYVEIMDVFTPGMANAIYRPGMVPDVYGPGATWETTK